MAEFNPDSIIDAEIEIPDYMALRCLAGRIRDIADDIGHAELRARADQLAELSLHIEKQAAPQRALKIASKS